MPNSNNITKYIQNFLYTVSRPHLTDALLSSVDIEKLVHADVAIKLMSLGALFHSGDSSKCVQLANHLNFKEIPFDERSLLVLIIFTKLIEHGFANTYRANALKHILTAICPEALLAHTQHKDLLTQKSLIKLNYAHTINTAVRGLIFFSEFIFAPGSRKCEVGYRIQQALASQGWRVSLHHSADIQHYSSDVTYDFVVIDALAFNQMEVDDICVILSRLRRYFRKIILIDTDVWAGRFDDMLRSISDHIDYIWGFTSDWLLANEPIFRDRSIVFPYFGGFDNLSEIIDADLNWNSCTFNFTGSVQLYNLNRISWLLDLVHHNLPIIIKITTPEIDDGLDPVHSQHIYAQTVAGTHGALNLTSRCDGSQPATGRSFEVISLKRLLVQESCPVFHNYFVEGEHFFEFSDIEQLGSTLDFLRTHPKTAQAICTQGHQFYKERYSCKKLVEHLQTIL
ncbi:MAG: glycosyltransferase [Desulfuromonadaceae bacterium]|nr:glycosyltransferase [Desulfuromonadaceae bacterium]